MRKVAPGQAHLFPELYMDWLKGLLRNTCQTTGAERYRCERGLCSKCDPNNLFQVDPESGLTVFETISGLKCRENKKGDKIRIPFYFLDTKQIELKSEGIWRLKELTDELEDIDVWVAKFHSTHLFYLVKEYNFESNTWLHGSTTGRCVGKHEFSVSESWMARRANSL